MFTIPQTGMVWLASRAVVVTFVKRADLPGEGTGKP
jgi:hypothetical protein